MHEPQRQFFGTFQCHTKSAHSIDLVKLVEWRCHQAYGELDGFEGHRYIRFRVNARLGSDTTVLESEIAADGVVFYLNLSDEVLFFQALLESRVLPRALFQRQGQPEKHECQSHRLAPVAITTFYRPS